MGNPERRSAAQRKLGEMHPYTTLYGGWMLGLLALAAAIGAGMWAWTRRPDGWTIDLGSPFPWLPFLIFGIPLAILVWRHFGPGARFRRALKRERRGL